MYAVSPVASRVIFLQVWVNLHHLIAHNGTQDSQYLEVKLILTSPLCIIQMLQFMERDPDQDNQKE